MAGFGPSSKVMANFFAALVRRRLAPNSCEAGCAEARLLTNAAFETNVALYTSAGYEIHKREPFMGGTTVHMSKKLTR